MTCDDTINAAHAALLQGNNELSEQLYREVLQKEPDHLCALDGLGVLLCQKGETEQGIALFEQALNLLRQQTPPNSQPNSQWEAAILFHLGLSYRALGLPHEALKFFTESAALIPPSSDLVLNLGQLYFELEQYPQAAEQFRILTTLQSDDASAWLTLGFILSNMNRHDEAAEALQTAEILDPASPEICFYLAEALRQAEKYEESLPHYQRMLPIGAEYPQAVLGYGKSLLALGNLDRGWDAMEFRFVSSLGTWERHHLTNWAPEVGCRPPGGTGRYSAQDVPESVHRTESAIADAPATAVGCLPVKARRVLAYSEESIGAELMFASCLPDLINSIEHCVVECETSLHSLFRRSFPRADFVPLADDYVRPNGNPWGHILGDMKLDAQIAFGSLPRFFRKSIDDFPLRKAYLVPDREMVARWETRLAGLGDAKKIGILWSGTWTAETPRQTSLPHQELRSLMNRHSEAAWVNLQLGSHQNALNQQHSNSLRGLGVAPRIFPEAFQYDLDAMAALLVALDLVITPPGYVAHLAGALGVRTWLLVPEGADWRHTIAEQTADGRRQTADGRRQTAAERYSVWHPSVKMYRQAKGESWQHFFAMVGDDLEKFMTTHKPPEEMPVTLALPERRRMAMPKAA